MDRLSQALMSASNRGRLSLISAGAVTPGESASGVPNTNAFTVPSTVRDGDIGVVWYHAPNNQATPSGWTQQLTVSSPGFPTNYTTKVWTKILTSAEAGTTITLSSVNPDPGTYKVIHFSFFRPTRPATSITIGDSSIQSLGFITENTSYAAGVNSTGQTGDIIGLMGFYRSKGFTPSSNRISNVTIMGQTAAKLYQQGEAGDNFSGSFTTWSDNHVYWKFYIKINS